MHTKCCRWPSTFAPNFYACNSSKTEYCQTKSEFRQRDCDTDHPSSLENSMWWSTETKCGFIWIIVSISIRWQLYVPNEMQRTTKIDAVQQRLENNHHTINNNQIGIAFTHTARDVLKWSNLEWKCHYYSLILIHLFDFLLYS